MFAGRLKQQVRGLQSELRQQVTALTERVQVLEARLRKDNHNSDQPTASDGPAKRPQLRSLRQKSSKKSGGQDGHPGVTRRLADDPDVVIPRAPKVSAGCGPRWKLLQKLAGNADR